MAALERQLEEERQKSEDLQFRIDEATICGGNETVNISIDFHLNNCNLLLLEMIPVILTCDIVIFLEQHENATCWILVQFV